MHEKGVQTQYLKVSSKRDKESYSRNLFRGQLLSFTDLIDCIWEVLSGKYFGKSLWAGLYCRACDLQNKVPDLPHPTHKESPHLAWDKGSIPPSQALECSLCLGRAGSALHRSQSHKGSSVCSISFAANALLIKLQSAATSPHRLWARSHSSTEFYKPQRPHLKSHRQRTRAWPQLTFPNQALRKCLWAESKSATKILRRPIHIPSMIKLQQISTLSKLPSWPPGFVGDMSNNPTCIFNRMKCQAVVQDLNNNRLHGMAVVFP